MGDPATSRRMIARAAWLSTSGGEESREYLQERLTLLSGLMFWTYAVLLSATHVMYWRYPHIKPRDEDLILVICGIALGFLLAMWRLYLVRRPLTIQQLHGIDLFYAVGTGTTLGLIAYLARDFQPSAYGCALYGYFMVLLRSIVVPSTGTRTAIAGAITTLPMVVASGMVAIDLPPPALVAATVVISSIVVVLASMGSRIIYGLTQKVRAAMQLGSYTLVRKIGQGGMGEVYRARHTLLRRPTAIKLIHPSRVDAETLDRFEREVQFTSQLTHPNTVQVYDFGRSQGLFYYAMEYLDGINLYQLVREYGRQPQDRVIHVLAQVCGALHEAHRNGIVHRDIKPENIILCERGAVLDVAKVVDFGLVKEITRNDGESSQAILGTPAFVAPEAVTDPDSVGPAADLYGLGAVGYYLLTGKLVFEGKTALSVCLQHVQTPPTPPSQVVPGIAPGLEALILECLAKERTARPSAEQLAQRLRALPRAGDWTDDGAQEWWRTFHERTDRDLAGSEESRTITVDLGRRDDPATPLPRRSRRQSRQPASVEPAGKRGTRVRRAG